MAKKITVCPLCKQATEVKGLSIIWLIIWLMCGVLPGIAYFCLRMFGGKKCRNCGCKF